MCTTGTQVRTRHSCVPVRAIRTTLAGRRLQVGDRPNKGVNPECRVTGEARDAELCGDGGAAPSRPRRHPAGPGRGMRARCVPDLGVSSGAAALVVAVLGAAAITVAPLTPWP